MIWRWQEEDVNNVSAAVVCRTNHLQLYSQITKSSTQTDPNRQKEALSSSPHKPQSTVKSSTGKRKAKHEQLKVGTEYLVGSYKANENLLKIVDQVTRDHQNRYGFISDRTFNLRST